ncbi:MAG: hypothetical protein ACRD09_00035 [Vicinamibacterales bacterium]
MSLPYRLARAALNVVIGELQPARDHAELGRAPFPIRMAATASQAVDRARQRAVDMAAGASAPGPDRVTD